MFGNPFRQLGSAPGCIDLETREGCRVFAELAHEQTLVTRARGLGHLSTFDLLRQITSRLEYWHVRSDPLTYVEEVEAKLFPEYIGTIQNILVRVDEVDHHTGGALERARSKIETDALANTTLDQMCARLANICDCDLRRYIEEFLNRKCGQYGQVDAAASATLVKLRREQATRCGARDVAAMLDKLYESHLRDTALVRGKPPRGDSRTTKAQNLLTEYEVATRGLTGAGLRETEDEFAKARGMTRKNMRDCVGRARKVRAKLVKRACN